MSMVAATAPGLGKSLTLSTMEISQTLYKSN